MYYFKGGDFYYDQFVVKVLFIYCFVICQKYVFIEELVVMLYVGLKDFNFK